MRQVKALISPPLPFLIISNRFEIEAAAQRLRAEVGDVRILVNNAGIISTKR